MRSRRTFLTLGASTILAGTAGCSDRIPFIGDEPMEFSAQPAAVPQAVVDETGYEAQDLEDVVMEETVEAGGQSQLVVVTNWQAEYDKPIDVGGFGAVTNGQLRAGVFSVLTTPQVNVLGRSFNPIADMDSDELAEQVQDRYDGVDQLERVGDDTITIVGESTTVAEFEGEADLVGEGVTVNLTLHIAEAVPAGEDFIVGFGAYPTELRDEEQQHVMTLLESIEHGE